ncbi:UNVERIFIED_CONTAM: Histone-lysine N-methyltransferase ATXR3 [Sesamum latifolium]|uniref:Histone-lysine N-methyltransferase ATXR3 n=1 Tax=Sesamum latifolium TaxID=2727402 RepID=A0AAW2WRJ8_9LAMI
MTKAGLVPPVTRKYEVIDHYIIVADEEEVRRKMQVSLPEDYAEKLNAQRNGTEESDMEIPEVKDYKPRKSLGDEVIEQEVYGIDPYTHNLLLDSMPEESDWSLVDKHIFIEEVLLRTLNKQVRNFTGSGNTPMMYPLKPVFEEILEMAGKNNDRRTMRLCQFILKAIDSRPEDNYVAYRKGLGVVCNKEGGFSEDDFVVEFLGEVYPTWKWFEKQDGIRALQKNNNDPAPEFYNIYLERPKGDADGYDLVVVDAMHKANYASRICHSCRPNCEAKVTAVDGQYQIGIYSVRPISYGEEITFDYNSVTEVGEIEERMRNGYYAIRGLNFIKEDISRMCRDAIKIKNRGDARDMNRIVTLFIRLATSLDKGPKLAYARDEMMKSWKDDSPPGFSSSSKYKKSFGKVSERKQSYRSNGLPFMNEHFDSGDYASDREIRRRLSKLNKKFLHSGSDTSDDFDKSSDGSTADSTSTASETESDLEYTSEGALGESRGGHTLHLMTGLIHWLMSENGVLA